MPKIIESLEFDSPLLKKHIEKNFESLTEFASRLETTKQNLHFWLEQGKMPTAKLFIATKLLKLNSDLINKVIPHQTKKNYQVLFRTRRNLPVMVSNKTRASKIAQEFFEWHQPTVVVKQKITTIKSQDPIQFAHKMQEQLGISDFSSLTTASLVKTLEKFNIHVLFVDFDEIFDFKNIKKNVPCAFCVKEDSDQKYVIVVNLREPYQNMLWIIIHELTHIFAGDLEKHSSDLVEDETQEKFANKVAIEFITPNAWFKKRKASLISQFSENNRIAVYYTEEISRKLNSSFMGVILALSEHEIISSHVKSYLMAVNHNKNTRGDFHKIHQIISPAYDDNRFSFWSSAFKNFDALNYLKFQSLIRKKSFDDSISLDRISELFGLSEIQVDKLKGVWENDLSSDL